MQRELLGSQQKATPSSLPGRLIRDAHTFAETFMANVNEDTARSYSLEVLKLATGLVNYAGCKSRFEDRFEELDLEEMSNISDLFAGVGGVRGGGVIKFCKKCT